MKIGYLTDLTGDVIEFAGRNGIAELELMADRELPFDVDVMSADQMAALRDRFERNNVKLSSLAWFITNHLEPDAAAREANVAYLRKLIEAAKFFGAGLISIGTQHHPSLSIKGNMEEALDLYQQNFSVYARIAEEAGVRLCIENCPEFGNLAYSPEAIEQMFERVPSAAIGLEYDPSHLVWQGIDPIRFLKHFAQRVYTVHAKDTEFLEDNLFRYGVAGRMLGEAGEEDLYWRYRLPGLGVIDWTKLFNTLYEIGFDGTVFIENEDPLFLGGPMPSEDPVVVAKRYEGVVLARRFLSGFIA